MKQHISLLKKHIPWMLVSYALIAFLLYNFMLTPQEKLLDQSRREKNRVEYDYLRLKNSPGFIASVGETVSLAKNALNEFEWLHAGYDPNLLFFARVSETAERTGVSFTRFERADNRKDVKYYAWNAEFQGRFESMCDLLRAIENDSKYLRIDMIEVKPGEETPLFTVTILGIRYLE